MNSTPVLSELDLLAAARNNEAFRRVLETGQHAQVVLMTIDAGDQIGEEVHAEVDQLFIFVAGHGEAILDGTAGPVAPSDLVFVRAGTRHNIVNHAVVPMRLITIYAPPQHAPGTVHLTKADAEANERD
jgi:mannose-6-phosphate isomerase-like protein (cupin superfamily)